MPPSPRRWFRFSLRTLLIAVAVLSIPGAYVAHEWRVVKERRAALEEAEAAAPRRFHTAKANPAVSDISRLRRAFGDEEILFCLYAGPIPQKTLNRFRAAFPETSIGSKPSEVLSRVLLILAAMLAILLAQYPHTVIVPDFEKARQWRQLPTAPHKPTRTVFAPRFKFVAIAEGVLLAGWGLVVLYRRGWLRDRRLRFSLRTALIAFTLTSIWLGWQGQIVRERKAALRAACVDGPAYFFVDSNGWPPEETGDINWVRRALRDQPIGFICVGRNTPTHIVARLQRAFPKSEVRVDFVSHLPSEVNFKRVLDSFKMRSVQFQLVEP